jgi:hypothetical protein
MGLWPNTPPRLPKKDNDSRSQGPKSPLTVLGDTTGVSQNKDNNIGSQRSKLTFQTPMDTTRVTHRHKEHYDDSGYSIASMPQYRTSQPSFEMVRIQGECLGNYQGTPARRESQPRVARGNEQTRPPTLRGYSPS